MMLVNSREQARQVKLMGQAKIPILAEMSEISYDEARGPAFVRAMSLARSMSWVETGNNLCLFGSSGSGNYAKLEKM